MLLLLPLGCFLVTLTVLTHYECLRLISHFISGGDGIPRHKLLIVIFGALAAHIFEIAIFGGGYWLSDVALHVGNFAGIHVLHAADYFYFSAEAYTSLGIGNLYPVGNLRLLAGMETLNGLLLIGWSTSYTFLAMTRYWDPK
jgi:Ion channel